MSLSSGRNSSGMRIEPFRTIKTLNPLVYWRMDEISGVFVNSGSLASKNLTAVNITYNVTKVPTRSPKGSASFDGATSFATVANSIISGVAPTFSIGMWIKTTTTSLLSTLLMQQSTSPSTPGWSLTLLNGVTIKMTGISDIGNDFIATGALPSNNDGTAKYIGITVDSTHCSVYLNGMLLFRSGVRAGGTYPSTSDIHVGSSYTTTDFYNGTMSDVFVTQQVMSQSDHYVVYRNGMLNAATPLSDNWGDAQTLAITNTTNPRLLDLSAASLEYGERTMTSGAEITGNQTLWYKFTVPVIVGHNYGTNYNFSSSGYSHGFSLMRDVDGTMAGMTHVNGYTGFPSGSGVYRLVTGQTYYVRLFAWNDSVVGNLTFDVYYSVALAPPANDDLANASVISVINAGTIVGTTVSSGIEVAGETAHSSAGGSVWYKFQADVTGGITLDGLLSPGVDLALSVYIGTSGSVISDFDFTSPNFSADDEGPSSEPILIMPVVSGTWYYVQVTDYLDGTSFTLSWSDIT